MTDQPYLSIITDELGKHRDKGGWPLMCECRTQSFNHDQHAASAVAQRLLAEGYEIRPVSDPTLRDWLVENETRARLDVERAFTREGREYANGVRATLRKVLEKVIAST